MKIIKEYIKNLVYNYEHHLNYKKYWLRRLDVQRGGTGVYFLYKIIWLRRQENKFCSATGIGLATEDSPTAWLDGPINFPHGLCNIIIARNVRIGKNVTIYQNVTIAEENRSKLTVIEDDVIIGAGAVILNNSHIGRGSRIGANAVVCRDVPANSCIVGVPERIIK